MADAEMMAQVTGGSGFIAALDQSGGSTPGALKLYGISESEYGSQDEMFRADARDARADRHRPRLHRPKGDRDHPVRATMDGEAKGQARPVFLVAGARRGAVPEGRQGA